MSAVWDAIVSLDDRVKKLSKAVERATRPSPARSRELMTVIYQEVEVDRYMFTLKNGVFQNGDIDTIEIWRLGVTVALNTAPTDSPQRRVYLQHAAGGWVLPAASAAAVEAGVEPIFDFRWTYSVLSRQAQYSRDFCNSEMLIGLDKGRALDFRAPLILPRGEQVEFNVEPTSFLVPNSSGSVTPATQKFYVGFTGLGFRRQK